MPKQAEAKRDGVINPYHRPHPHQKPSLQSGSLSHVHRVGIHWPEFTSVLYCTYHRPELLLLLYCTYHRPELLLYCTVLTTDQSYFCTVLYSPQNRVTSVLYCTYHRPELLLCCTVLTTDQSYFWLYCTHHRTELLLYCTVLTTDQSYFCTVLYLPQTRVTSVLYCTYHRPKLLLYCTVLTTDHALIRAITTVWVFVTRPSCRDTLARVTSEFIFLAGLWSCNKFDKKCSKQ